MNLPVSHSPSSGIDFRLEGVLAVLSVLPSSTGATTVIVVNVRVRSIVKGRPSFPFSLFHLATLVPGVSPATEKLGRHSEPAFTCAAITYLASVDTELAGASVDPGREVAIRQGP